MNATPHDRVPIVSVLMLTYNHERFIEQAIKSVLMQVTNFPIELVIGEDCSTDGTREIVKRYAAVYPQIVRPLLHEKNIGVHANLDAVLNSCTGSYIATLEGDDYWTSPHKLQKQVDFLELHPDHTLCGTRFVNIQGDNPTTTSDESPAEKESGTLEDLLRWNYLLTCTVVYRAGLVPTLPDRFKKVRNPDMVFWALLAEHGRVGFINEVMAAYRLHNGGVWSGISIGTRIAALEYTINSIHSYFSNRYPGLHRQSLCIRYLECAVNYSWTNDYASARCWLVRAFLKSPPAFLLSPDMGLCVAEHVNHYVSDPVKYVCHWWGRRYHKTRIWAGAQRRRFVKTSNTNDFDGDHMGQA
jgi:glycosyltransferase involved in cell wall biosynthesis